MAQDLPEPDHGFVITDEAKACSPVSRQVNTLSGGNIQRVLLTQVLGSSGRLYVLSYPNRGLDVASTRQVQQLILAQAGGGSRDPAHLGGPGGVMMMSDRIWSSTAESWPASAMPGPPTGPNSGTSWWEQRRERPDRCSPDAGCAGRDGTG